MAKIRARIFYLVTTLLGGLLFISLLSRIGLSAIIVNIKAFGWAIAIFILLEGVASIFYAWATRFCFAPPNRTISLWMLWKITMSERAISYVTFSAGMGGDVVKWSILERHCSGAEAASAVMVYRLAYFLSKLVFCLIWAVPILMVVDLDPKLKVSLLVGTALLAGGLGGFLIFQRRGLFGALLENTLGRWLGTGYSKWIRRQVGSFDARLRNYHQEYGKAFYVANLILWIGFTVGGVLQTWVFAVVVLHITSPVIPLIIWILGSWADMVFFFVPAGIGTKEFARVVVFEALHYSPAMGASFALILRAEEIFWTAVGLLIYAFALPPEIRKKRSAGDPPRG